MFKIMATGNTETKVSEKLLEKKLRTAVEKLGGQCWKLAGGFVTGLPDRLVLLPGGRALFAEVKTTGEKPKPRQLYIISILIKLGFKVYVIDSEETLQNFLNDI